MSYALFDRVVNVITAGDGPKGTQFDREFYIDFEVTRGRTSEPNEAKITIYNLARSTRLQFRQEFKRIALEAGYVGGFSTIFAGEIKKVSHRRVQEGVATEIIAGDGEVAWQKASINKTLDAPSPRQAIEQLVREMPGVTLGRIYGLENAPSFRRPLVLNGMVRDRLDELARSYGARWSIQNGVFEWVENTLAGSRARIVELSPETGLVDTPIVTEKGVQARCLLNPALRPNDAVEIRSGYIDQTTPARIVDDSSLGGGVYRINEVRFAGSTYQSAFYADIDAQRMDGATVEQEPDTQQAISARNRVR